MKRIYTLISFLALTLIITSCKKEVDSENPTSTTTTTFPVVFTSNINLIDEGASFTMNGVSNHSSATSLTPTIAGEILFDSLLRLNFVDEITQKEFTLTLSELGGDIIQPGTYSFANPLSDYQLSMALENTQNGYLYMYANSFNNQGLTYDGQPVVPNGAITISSVSQTAISGTISGELYYSSNGSANQEYKAIITNGSFTCDIVRY